MSSASAAGSAGRQFKKGRIMQSSICCWDANYARRVVDLIREEIPDSEVSIDKNNFVDVEHEEKFPQSVIDRMQEEQTSTESAFYRAFFAYIDEE